MRLYKVRKGNEEQRINERLSARCIFKIVPLYWFQLHMFSQNNIRIVYMIYFLFWCCVPKSYVIASYGHPYTAAFPYVSNAFMY